MKNFAFISRHTPTAEQFRLCEEAGVNLLPIGDYDAFSVIKSNVLKNGSFEGVVVVHPAAAMRLAADFIVGVFENAQRQEEGGKMTFFPKRFHMYDLR